MRLTEIRDKVRTLRIPNGIFEDLMALEVETVDEHSPDVKQGLADEMQRAVESGKARKVPLSMESKQYILGSSLPNMIDIARDNMDRRKIGQLQQFQARLHAKLTS